MGIITKIEDKLSGNKSNQTEEQTYDKSSTEYSSVRHPITSTQQTSSPTTSSNIGTSRDGYGTQNAPYNATTSSGYVQGSQPTTHTIQTASGVASDRQPTTTTATNTNTTSTSERQYYDPYSRKGQQTAANAAHTQGMSPSTHQKSNSPFEDANLSRSQRGGVLNNTEPQQYSQPNSSTLPATGTHGMTTASGEPMSSHHYGRDVGIVGGAGATGVGAYELNKHHGTTSESRDRYAEQSSTYPPTKSSTGGHQNYSYVQPSAGYAQFEDPSRRSADTLGASSTGDSASGLTQSKKMASAYEAGYKDGMEHMKAEMMQKFSNTQL